MSKPSDAINDRKRMSLLALKFPSLHEGVPGIAPWDAEQLDCWLTTSGAVTAGSLCAGRFVLYVWNPETEWQSGPFSLRETYGRLDLAHWNVLVDFIRNPFFP